MFDVSSRVRAAAGHKRFLLGGVMTALLLWPAGTAYAEDARAEISALEATMTEACIPRIVKTESATSDAARGFCRCQIDYMKRKLSVEDYRFLLRFMDAVSKMPDRDDPVLSWEEEQLQTVFSSMGTTLDEGVASVQRIMSQLDGLPSACTL